MSDKKFAKENIENIETSDLLDAMYGEIQSIVESGTPENVAFHYFLPPIPFGPELASFMDVGPEPKEVENEDEAGNERFTVNDMMRSAVNFAVMTNYVPSLGEKMTNMSKDSNKAVVDLNALISSGKSIEDTYESVLNNCLVINNSMSEENEKKLQKLRSVLYKEPKQVSEESSDEELLESGEGGGESGDVNVDELMGDGVDSGDFVNSPDKMSEPTKVMKLYRALENKYQQVRAKQLEKLGKISPNDPNAGVKTEAAQQRIDAAKKRWETQGRKTKVEAIMARIDQLSQGGMPQYVSDLRSRFEANELRAALFASEEGVSLAAEKAHYTALRPNGILEAPARMQITLNSSKMEDVSRMSSSSTSASAGGMVPGVPLFASASGSKSTKETENRFFSEGFKIEFEIVQGIIDRPWLDVGFLESSAYSTVDPDTKEPLDQVNEITKLSDGGDPPEGQMPAIPMTAYFVRNLTLESEAFKSMSDSEREKFKAEGGVSVLGFGASSEHTSKTTESKWRQASTEGKIAMDGLFLIGFASRYLKEAPTPDFEDHPNEDDWIGPS